MKDTYAKNFDETVLWFYKEYLDCPLVNGIPQMIGCKQIRLMDLFRTIKEMGGAKKVYVKGKWGSVANALGLPNVYAIRLKECYEENLKQMDLHYEVGKGLLEIENKDYVVWKGMRKRLEIDTIDGFITFMGIMKHTPTAMKYKDLLKRKINALVEWFHKDYLNCVFEASLPPQVGNTKICLFDLYVLVESMGGSEKVSQKEEWKDVALSFGLPSCLKTRLQGIFGRYLEMLDSYYKCIMEEKGTATESRNAGKSAGTAGYIGLDEDNGKDMKTLGNEGSEENDGKTQNVHTIDADKSEPEIKTENTGTFDYDFVNIVYDDGERMVLTFGQEEENNSSNDTDEEPSIEEYYDTDGKDTESLDSK